LRGYFGQELLVGIVQDWLGGVGFLQVLCVLLRASERWEGEVRRHFGLLGSYPYCCPKSVWYKSRVAIVSKRK
jgi:hypothetical protein